MSGKGKKNKKATPSSADVAAVSAVDPAEHSVESGEASVEPVIDSVAVLESNDVSSLVAEPEQPVVHTAPESEQVALEQAPLLMESTQDEAQLVHDAIQVADAAVVVHVDLDDHVDIDENVDAVHAVDVAHSPAVAGEQSVNVPVQTDSNTDAAAISNTQALNSTEHYESLETFTHHRSHSESNLLESDFVPISPLRRVEITNCSHAEKEGDTYTAYIIEFEFGTDQHGATQKRFSDFFTFDSYLRAHGFSCLPPLPSKTLVKLFNPEFVAERQMQLQSYLKRLNCRRDLRRYNLLHTFLDDQSILFADSSPALLFSHDSVPLPAISAASDGSAPCLDADQLKRIAFSRAPFVARLSPSANHMIHEMKAVKASEQAESTPEPISPADTLWIQQTHQINAQNPISASLHIDDVDCQTIIVATKHVVENKAAPYLPEAVTSIFSSIASIFNPPSQMSSNSQPFLLMAFQSQQHDDKIRFHRNLCVPLSSEVLSMAWDHNRRWLFLGLADGALQIFAPAPDFSYCANIGKCPLRSDGLRDLCFHSTPHSIDNDLLIMSCHNGSVGLYSPNSQEVLTAVPINEQPINVTKFDPISQRLLVGCNSSAVNVVDFHFDASVTTPIDTLKQDSRMFAAAAPKITARLTQHNEAVRCMLYDAPTGLLVTAGDDCSVGLVSLGHSHPLTESSRYLGRLLGHSSPVSALCFLSHDASIINHVRFVASADDEGFIVIWDLVLKASIFSFKAHASRITALHWSTSRRSLVSVGHDSMVKSWQLHGILTTSD